MNVNLILKPIHPYVRRFGHIQWKKSPPFFVNPRGILIHRVRSLTTHLHRGGDSHEHVDYYCGSGANTRGAEGFTSNPPKARLLCERCEEKAIEAGQQTADELTGRHVHVGRLRAFRTCCRDKEQ